MADRIIQTETLQSIANALRGGASQSASDKINVTDFAEVAEDLKDVNESFVGVFNRNATSVTIPKGVVQIGNEPLFRNFTSLTEINLPSTLTTISSNGFNGCTNLSSITIPEGVVQIGNGAFYNCSSLVEVNLPSTLTSIGKGVFNGCTNLSSITIPEGITTIDTDAFYNCSSLVEVNLPSTITSIDSGAFSGINANAIINCGFSEGVVSGAPWGAPNTVTINYDVTE